MTVTNALKTPESVFLALMFTSMFTEGSDAADVVWNNTFCFLSSFFANCIARVKRFSHDMSLGCL